MDYMYLNMWCTDNEFFHLCPYDGELVEVLSEVENTSEYLGAMYECRLRNGDYENIPETFLSSIPPESYLFI